jgi:hypothetical protein
MKVLFLLSALVLTISLSAQDSASVIIHKDPRIDMLLKKGADINTALRKATTHTAKGYRLLVLNTTDREEAMSGKTRIYSMFPGVEPYLQYQSPYYRLRAGDFQTREEAAKYQKLLSTYFPKGVFIVSDLIIVKPEKGKPVENDN